MPRVANIYSLPVGTTAVTDTTIESTKYNNFTADVEQDLNLPRPISAGGTGGTNAAQALANLGAAMGWQRVTDWDSFVFQPGMFYAPAATTGTAPGALNAHGFVGWCYMSDVAPVPPNYIPANQNLVIEARDQNDTTVPGTRWIRERKAGVWGVWTSELTVINNITNSTTIRYDQPQTLTIVQQLQAAANQGVVSYVGDQPAITTAQELIACLNIAAICYTNAQPTITAPQQLIAANNAMVPSAAGVQTLTTPQKIQARQNIGADTGAFLAQRTGGSAQTGMTGNAFNKMQMNNELKDQNGWYTPSGNFRYIPQQAGSYFVKAGAVNLVGASGITIQAAVYKNGVAVAYGDFMNSSSLIPGGDTFSSTAVALIVMNGTTDYVEAWVFLPNGQTALDGQVGYTNFSGFRVGD